LLHAQNSHIDLSLSEATRCVDDRISLETVGEGSYSWERETHISGNASDDEVLAPSRLDRIDETFSSQALTLVRSMPATPCNTSASSGISGPHIFSVVVVTITGTLSASIARVRPTMLCLELKDVDVKNACVQTDLVIHQQEQCVIACDAFRALRRTSRHNPSSAVLCMLKADCLACTILLVLLFIT